MFKLIEKSALQLKLNIVNNSMKLDEYSTSVEEFILVEKIN